MTACVEAIEAVEGVQTAAQQPPGARGRGQVLAEDAGCLVDTLIAPETETSFIHRRVLQKQIINL